MTSERDVFKLRSLVLAAGQGQRLRPLTLSAPKPLLPFLGLPILSQTLRKIAQVKNPLQGIAVNAHYLSDKLISFQKQCIIPFFLSEEKSVLGTGGAVDGLRDSGWLKDDEHLLIYNGDIVTDIDIDQLIAKHRASGAIATCVFLDHMVGTNPCLTKDGFLVRISGDGNRTFAGVYILSPDFIRTIPKGTSDIIKTFQAALSQGAVIAEYHHRGLWYDIGNPKAYAESQLAVVSDENKLNCLEIKESLAHFKFAYDWRPGFFSATPHTGSKVVVNTPVVINGSFDMSRLVSVVLDHAVIMPNASLNIAKVYRQICLDDVCIGF